MNTEHAMSRLVAYHERIAAILERANHALGGAQPDVTRLSHIRWELMRALREYQLFKHTEIFDPLLRSAVVERRTGAATLKARCIAMADGFVRHVERWTLAGLTEASADYLADAREMARTLAAYLPEERRSIAQLLHGIERTRAA